jgi:hypothetical protein
MLSRAALLCGLVALALPAWASATGGRYTIVNGTRPERQTVVSALDASAFDWNLVRTRITIQIVRGLDSQAVPGTMWLDADLLDTGIFSWGVVQHEYAHQWTTSSSMTQSARNCCPHSAGARGATRPPVPLTATTAANDSHRLSPGPTDPRRTTA